ncbi:transglutaminase domain-containing protein [Methanobrevibacter sp.]|uniref:transglutaminase domain-containing protein n=1 Tax=Methanobrevibacter sp. TaxID=66852 RepID=UPI0038678111
MNKKILLTFIFVLIVALSVGTINASDVNDTDSHAIGLEDEAVLAVSESGVDNDPSNDILKSQDSSTLSTNAEDSNVLKSDDNAKSIDVSKTITAKDITKYYMGSTKYTATFLNTSGAVLANTNVKIVVDEHSYTKTTNSNGVASLDINLEPGTYKVVATNPVTGFSLTTNFVILSTISANDLTKVVTDGKEFTATFYKSNGKFLANKNVRFKINGKTYKAKTNSKGVASLSLTFLAKGKYKIISYNYKDGMKKTNNIKVVKSAATTLTASDYTFLKSDSKKIKVKLLNKYGYAPGKGQTVKFKINGKSYTAQTNKNGNAKLKLPSLDAGVYTVKYSFDKTSFYKASKTTSKVTVIPSKDPTYTVKSTKTFGHGAGTPFKVALTSGKVPLANKKVTLSVNGVSYAKTTDSKGIVSLPINLNIGKYTVSYSNKADSKINAKSGSCEIEVIQRGASSITWKTGTTFNQGTQSCQMLVLDSKNTPISNGNVKLTVNDKTYTAKTASNGLATISASFTPGTYKVSYSFDGNNLNAPSSGSASLNVLKVTAIPLKDVITASNNLKNYIANNNQIPTTVTAGGITFTTQEFLYVMGSAISQLGSSKTTDVPYLTGIKAAESPSGDTINSKELYKADYLTVARNLVNFINTNKKAPNYGSSAVGKIAYPELVDAFSRILAFYGNNKNTLPNYCVITYNSGGGSSSSETGSGLNEPNTVSDLSQYLKATTNCQVGNAQIKSKVNSIISGLSSTSAKAKAIYNFVRDQISYSFYYNTNHGAVGTLNAGSGNCVDQAHLLIAMYRTAGIPARYVHGVCKFSSGSTYGHVWAQVLVDGKWVVVDPTSSRNSFGNVVNWNTKSFTLNGIYSKISF